MSHPSWVRGLKPTPWAKTSVRYVAPLVGAWIETTHTKDYDKNSKSHPSWVRGLKLHVLLLLQLS